MTRPKLKLVLSFFLALLLGLWIFGPILFNTPTDNGKKWLGLNLPEGSIFESPEKEKPFKDLVSTPQNVLSFWADWCGPCVYEMPQINKNYMALKAAGITVNMVNVNSGIPDRIYPEMKAWLISQKLNMLSTLFDFNSMYLEKFQMQSLPMHVGYDSSGKIIWITEGMIDWEVESIKQRF